MHDAAWLTAGALRMLAWTLIHSVWLGAAAALVVAASLRWIPASEPHLRYRTASGVLASLVIGTALLGRHLEADWTEHAGCWERVEHAGAAPPVLPQRCRGHVGSVAARLGAAWAPGPPGASRGDAVRGTGETMQRVLARAGGWLGLAPAERAAMGPAAVASRPLDGLAILWAVVAAALLARFLGGVLTLRRRVRGADPLPDSAADRRLRELGRALGVRRRVAVAEAPGLDAPVLAGWRRPTVLMPPRLAGALSHEELTALLAHELLHVRRADFGANLAQRAVEALFFFNPFVLWISGRVRAEREAACDRDVIRSGTSGARSYVAGLVAMELRRSGRDAPAAALSLVGDDLLGRARRLAAHAGGAGDARRRGWRPARTAALVAAIVLLALPCLPVAYAASAVSAYGVMSVDGRARRAALALRRAPGPHGARERPAPAGARPASPTDR